MIHTMRLQPETFERMKSGQKKIEVRINDQKRQRLTLNDLIIFEKIGYEQTLTVKTVELLHYKTFAQLVDHVPMELLGYPAEYSKEAYAQSMYQIYTREEEQQYGVVGIRVEVPQ